MHWSLTVAIVTLAVSLYARSAKGAPATRPASPLRVMSFNIRNSGMSDGPDGWSHRKSLFFQTINGFGPDLLGVQEVLADQHDDIAAALPDYQLAGVARDDGHRKGEWALVAFRRERFEQLDAGNFWLSPTPDRPSIGWDAACIRICSWVRLRDRSTGGTLLFADTHWDHIGVEARRHAAALTKQRLPALSKGFPVILVGDLNSEETDDSVVKLLHADAPGEVPLTDSYREAHPTRLPDEASYHAFMGGVNSSRIDFILHGPELRATAAEIDRRRGANGRYPSDHFAVTAVLTPR